MCFCSTSDLVFNSQAIYTTRDTAEIYINNVLKSTLSQHGEVTTGYQDGCIVLGRYKTNSDGKLGKLTVDWLTIWDRPLTEEERNLVHQN